MRSGRDGHKGGEGRRRGRDRATLAVALVGGVGWWLGLVAGRGDEEEPFGGVITVKLFNSSLAEVLAQVF